MIKIYTDKKYLQQEYRKHVFPLLLDVYFLKESELKEYYKLSDSLEESQLAIYPLNVVYAIRSGKQGEMDDFVSSANDHQKKVWIYSGGDMGLSLEYKGVTVFRLGGFHSKMSSDTEILPSFIQDPIRTHFKGDLQLAEKEEAPAIGFVGHAQGGFVKWFKEALNHVKWAIKWGFNKKTSDYQSFYPSSVRRAHYLKMLQNDPELHCRFILRNKYRAGAEDVEMLKQTTSEFYKNISETLYTFNIRGVGNFSVRFYETLAMGRIPVLVNTECRLPLHEEVDWNAHAIILDEKDIRQLPHRIKAFHSSRSDAELQRIQENNRKLWLEKLHRNGYFKTIHDQFIKANE